MRHIELSPELTEKLEQAARARGCSIEEFLASTISAAAVAASPAPAPPLVAFLQSAEFRVKFSDADRFLALLGWIAAQHREEFNDFVAHLESGRKYVGFSAEEIRRTCLQNQARPIPGTHYWAIMNLDTPTKRRFLRRLMVFVGQPDPAIDAATQALGPRESARDAAATTGHAA